jgi:sugar fermentation stimulation protein A
VYLEVKNCSLAEEGVALFPDAITKRGTRHLQELSRLRGLGHEAALIFCIQRPDTECFRPAAAIDPRYAEKLRSVYDEGVTILAYQADVRPDRIRIARRIPVSC